MDVIQNYAYKVSAVMSGGMMIKVCVQGHVPSWFVNEDQQANLWKLFGWAHLPIGISALVCSSTWPKEIEDLSLAFLEPSDSPRHKWNLRDLRYMLKFGIFGFTAATYLCMGPYRKVPANGEERVMTVVFGMLSGAMALDLAAYCYSKSTRRSSPRKSLQTV